MSTVYDSIYLSPHLDDVVLSCGAQIYQLTAAGKAILIVTLTAGDPPTVPLSAFAQSLHLRWQLSADIVATRRAEDIRVCNALGADHLHWDLPDCIYRRHPDSREALYTSEEHIFGPIHPVESALVERLARQMAELPVHRHVLSPLSVGQHVDHQLTRLAAERCFGTSTLSYYEDYPYVQKAGALEAALGEGYRWQPKIIPLTLTALNTKMAAIADYKSQISTLFSDQEDLVHQVKNYAASIGGERLWIRN